MKPTMLLMWIGVAGIAFAQQPPQPTTGGDTFNVNTGTGSNPCVQSYVAATAKMKRPNNNQAQYNKELIDAGVQRDICGARRLLAASTSSDLCDRNYSVDMEKVKEHEINNEAQYRKDQVDCQGTQSCDGGQRRYHAEQRKTTKEKIDADKQKKLCRSTSSPGDGSRDLVLRPNPPLGVNQTPPPDDPTLIAALDRCLRDDRRLTYYSSPNTKTYRGWAAYDNSTIFYNPAYLGQQRPYARAFWLASAFAAHVMNLEKQRYGGIRTTQQSLEESDLIVGFLAHCLVSQDLLPLTTNNSPDDPRPQFDDFLRRNQGLNSPGDAEAITRRENEFSYGWFSYGAGLPDSITHQ